MVYYRDHLKNLTHQSERRYAALIDALYPGPGDASDKIAIDGPAIRMAVDDFKTILTEIRRLK